MKAYLTGRWMVVAGFLLAAGAGALCWGAAPRVQVVEARGVTLNVQAQPQAAAPAPAAGLPADAQEVVGQFEAARAAAQKEMDEKLAPKRKELMAQLKVLQDKHTKAGDLDEAVAIRDRVRQLVMEWGGDRDTPLADPGTLVAYRGRIGKSFYFQVTGAGEGTIWGTDVYTDDSPLAVAAVHAGAVAAKEKGVVKVTILAGQAKYEGLTSNGVTSLPYGAFEGSYKVEVEKGP